MGLMDDLDRARAQKLIELDPFTLSFTWNTLASLASGQTVAVTVNNDSDFVLRYITGASYSAANVPVIDPDYIVTITDSSAARGLQDNPVHWRTIVGSAERPYLLPFPKLFKGGSTIVIAITNNQALASLVNISFAGGKVFYFKGYSREHLGVY